jgi:glycine/D-amino acid oxidase-like deaminating enzyme/nitrite reductase/ring-hydroxylating ferredoxin subunit
LDATSQIGEAARADRVSFWVASATGPDREALDADLSPEVAVVGGGIVGLTTALLLAEAGRDVTLLEADEVAAGVSGYTTAKVTAGHGLIYSHLATIDPEIARLYAEAQLAGLASVVSLCARLDIDCDLERLPNHVVVETDDEVQRLEVEARAASAAGLNVRLTDGSAVPFPARGSLVLEDQAQFHVRKYLLALAAALVEAGGRIFHHSRVTELTGDGPYVVRTADAELRARAVVVATHYPIVEQGFFVPRIHPRRSYVVAAHLTGTPPDGMFINAGTPTRSVRTAPLAGGDRIVLVGGEGHRVGQDDATAERYATLERFMREHFAVGETMFRWSTQDNHSIDRLPYVGRLGSSGDLYAATGFAGWGMTNGTAAALVLSDAIRGERNPWASVFDPGRRHLAASAKRLLVESANVAVHEVRPKLAIDRRASVEDVQPGEGAVLSIDGSEQAVSRDADGRVHVVEASCTHMGCTVTWNAAESTWDCPCHGSRFAPDGRVLHGPALAPLAAASREIAAQAVNT